MHKEARNTFQLVRCEFQQKCLESLNSGEREECLIRINPVSFAFHFIHPLDMMENLNVLSSWRCETVWILYKCGNFPFFLHYIGGKKRATGKHRTIEQKADNPRKSETKSIAKEVIKTTGD